MGRRVYRLMIAVVALAVALGVNVMGLKGDPEGCFLCAGEVEPWCDAEECPWDPPGDQCLHIACAQLCGQNFVAIRCTEDVPDCDFGIQVECTDEVSK